MTLPDWFDDAKLGVFVHWGLFAIPAFGVRGVSINDLMRTRYDEVNIHTPYVEWYLNALQFPDSPASAHHRAVHGGRPYEDFRAPFEAAAASFRASDWAKLFAGAGARYMVLVTKHHDGYCLWPSAVANPHKPGWTSTRDYVGETAAAMRAEGLRFGAYYSGGLDWTFRHVPIADFGDMLACVPVEDDYRAYARAQYDELIARTKPSVLWNDIAYPHEGDRDGLFAHYRKAVPDGVINDRWFANAASFARVRSTEGRAALNAGVKARMAAGADMTPPDMGIGDFRTPEYSDMLEFGARKFEACRGMDLSFGYNAQARDSDHLTEAQLITSFAAIVAHGGNLLLNAGPMASGAIPDVQQKLLRALGRFLSVNGEAIYGTRRAARATGIASDGTPYVTTQKGGTLYLLFTGAPGPEIALPGIAGARSVRRLDGGRAALGASGALSFVSGFPEFPVHGIALEGAHVL